MPAVFVPQPRHRAVKRLKGTAAFLLWCFPPPMHGLAYLGRAYSRGHGGAGELVRGALVRQTDRAFLWLVVVFGAGIALFFTWRFDPPPWISIAALAGGLSLLALRGRFLGASFLARAFMALALGHGAARLRTCAVGTPLLMRETRPFTLSGVVEGAEKRPTGNRIVVGTFALPDMAPEGTPKRLRLTIPTAHGIPAVGQRIVVRAVARPAALPVMPDGFQFQRFLYATEKSRLFRVS